VLRFYSFNGLYYVRFDGSLCDELYLFLFGYFAQSAVEFFSEGFALFFCVCFSFENLEEFFFGVYVFGFNFKFFRVLTTNSGSPSLRKPSSMKTATNFSPTALWTSMVTVVLSTPPEQAEITLLSPTVFLISCNEFSINTLALNTSFILLKHFFEVLAIYCNCLFSFAINGLT